MILLNKILGSNSSENRKDGRNVDFNGVSCEILNEK